MAVEFLADVYGLTGMGKKIKIAHMKELAEDCFLVGGTIFYIDETADGVYEFYDYNENLIHDVKVGDKPYAYRVIKAGTKDKYYVYHDECIRRRDGLTIRTVHMCMTPLEACLLQSAQERPILTS